MVLTFTENEDWPAADDLQSLDTQHVSREHFDTAVDMLDREGSVVLCGPPKSGKSSLGYALLKHYQQEGFAVHNLRSLCCSPLLSLSKGGRSFVLIDGGLGVVCLDSDQHKHCENLLFNTKTFRNNRHCLLVLTAYPHVLRELDLLEACPSRPLLPSTIRIDMTSRPQDPSPVFTPSAVSYLPLLQRMLHDPIKGRVMEALLAMGMLGIGRLELYPPEVEPTLQRLELTNVPSFDLKRLACFLKGSILSDTGSGFPSRLLYDAAGLALGRFCSLAVLLRVCDAIFLVQRVRTSGTPTESSILIGPAEEERLLLMQRMYELIVDGQLPELCQHPSLGCPVFLGDFRVFCTNLENYVQRLVNAVDKEHGLSLLYWSAWSPSEHLTRWMVEDVTGAKVLPKSLLTAALALVLFTPADAEARSEAKSFLNSLIRMKLKPAAKETLKLTLPLPRMFATEETRGRWAELKTRLQSRGVCYHDDLSLPIPATLLLVTVTEDAISVKLPSQHWYLALRLLADREVDETDDDGNTLLHLAADSGQLDAIQLAVKSGASLVVENNEGQTPCQLAQKRRTKPVETVKNNDSPILTLQAACRDGDAQAVKVALCQGVSVQHRDEQNENTPLHTACENGQTQIASLLIQLGAEVDTRNKDGVTPLYLACKFGHKETAELLLRRGSKVDTPDTADATPLYWACQRGDTATAGLLTEHGADINAARNSDGSTPLHLACQSGHKDVAALLIERGAGIDNTNKAGFTPLHFACSSGLMETAELLMGRGAGIDEANEAGFTPLHFACSSGLMETAELLIGRGAEINAKTGTGLRPLHLACWFGQFDVVQLLLDRDADVSVTDSRWYTPLHYASSTGHSDICKKLVVGLLLDLSDDDINARDAGGYTALHVACKSGHVKVASLLLAHGASINEVDKDDRTALHEACKSGHVKVVSLLLEHGASVNEEDGYGRTALHEACSVAVRDTDGRTALHEACICGNDDVVSLLLSPSAGSVDVTDNNDSSALHLACTGRERDHQSIVQMLLQLNNIDVNVKDHDDRTALHLASISGQADSLEQLLNNYNADVNAQDKNGHTAVHLASACGHAHLLKQLLNRGNADVNAKDKDGRTALHFASAKGHEQVVKQLLDRGNADVNAKDTYGFTALHYACYGGETSVMSVLLEDQYGADVNAVDAAGRTALDLAKYVRNKDVESMLLKRNYCADVNAPDTMMV